MFGTVVVGVGIAGRVRIRDLVNPLPSTASEKMIPKGFVSRRTLEDQQGLKQISLDDALAREDIHAAIICTENSYHEDCIRKFLEAGKHVCVEYPMALSLDVAHDLWDLADEKGKVLHVEHIELLTADYKQLKKDIQGKELINGTLHFTGGPLPPSFRFISFSGIARLTWLVDLFGELTLTSAHLVEEKDKNYIKLNASFHTTENQPLTWIEERGPGLSRCKNINFHFTSDTMTCLPDAPREFVGVFMQDFIIFSQKLQGQVRQEALQGEKRRILHCLELAEKIQQLCEKTTGSRM
ncbi:biliverdin reductase A [Erpetoichthys calabaricus]|uniref:Biliverdin reductase A n=1 Tax=Erpetoichthys calabaricus TaxID=27687 RepID=A0A8C4RW00_ERPCA|nr:biliverdin reductase A [Erpetoichthys calabaricus]XP_028659891.1 biliverdin reductase A [Erpetoichthys calabaricus]XP_051785048.1 biliverdin reductase A [Erpetoichthys calabaricus]